MPSPSPIMQGGDVGGVPTLEEGLGDQDAQTMLRRLESPAHSDGAETPPPMRGVSGDSKSEEEDENETVRWLKNYEKDGFKVVSLMPVLTWMPSYIRALLGKSTEADIKSVGLLPFSLTGDLIAGFTVGFMLVPQSLAFAMLAGLPVQVGLYSSFAPLLVYSLLGTIRQVQPGPTALMSLLCGQALDSLGYEDAATRMQGAAIMALLVGVISVFLGAIRFGFIVDFMSHSVMSAFCSAAGVTIATSQLKHLVGITMPRQKYWWKTVGHLVSHLGEADVPTVAMGGTLLFLLVFLKQWKQAGSKEKRGQHKLWRCFPKDKTSVPFRGLKLVADMSSLFSVLLGWCWGAAYRAAGVDSVKLVGEVSSDGFHLGFPNLKGHDIGGMFTGCAIIAVVGFLETMAVGGKFAMAARYNYDANQELMALGSMNVVGALFSGYPTTGSFSRTAVNAMFGATSLVACAFSSMFVFGSVYVLLPVVALLPLASLAPIIIQGAIGVVSWGDFLVANRANRNELAVMVCTFVVSLGLSVKEGLLTGFVLSVMKTMHELANPNLAVLGKLPDGTFRDIRNFRKAEQLPNAVVVRMDARLSFTNARKMKEFTQKATYVRELQGEEIRFVVIDGKSINHVDLTGCEMLEVLAESMQARKIRLIIANLKGPVSKCLAKAGVPKHIRHHGGCLCIDMDQAMAIINGGDEASAAETFEELLTRVNNATVQLGRHKASRFVCHANGPTKPAKGSPNFDPSKSDLALPGPLDLESLQVQMSDADAKALGIVAGGSTAPGTTSSRA